VLETLWSYNDVLAEMNQEGAPLPHPPLLADWTLLVLYVKQKVTGRDSVKL
jgi:hypothetical protein